jgi:hypothetical protein
MEREEGRGLGRSRLGLEGGATGRCLRPTRIISRGIGPRLTGASPHDSRCSDGGLVFVHGLNKMPRGITKIKFSPTVVHPAFANRLGTVATMEINVFCSCTLLL